MKSEATIQNEIRIALSKYAIVFRGNVGTFFTADGRPIKTGLPRGFSDLFGFRKHDGKMFFLETKNKNGRTSVYQDRFLNEMQKYDVITGVARSAEDALKIIGVDS